MNRRLRPASPFWKVSGKGQRGNCFWKVSGKGQRGNCFWKVSGKGQRGNCFWKVSGEIAPLCLRSPASPVLYNNEPLLQSSMTLTTSHCYEAQSRQQRTERQKVCSQDIPRGRLHPSGREGITPQPITTVKAGLLNQSQLWRQHPSTNHKLWRQHSSTNHNSEGSTPQPITNSEGSTPQPMTTLKAAPLNQSQLTFPVSAFSVVISLLSTSFFSGSLQTLSSSIFFLMGT